MRISEVSRRTGLSRAAVRFYVRPGLLKPKAGAKGGSNPHQVFSDEDVASRADKSSFIGCAGCATCG